LSDWGVGEPKVQVKEVGGASPVMVEERAAAMVAMIAGHPDLARRINEPEQCQITIHCKDGELDFNVTPSYRYKGRFPAKRGPRSVA